jgi:beta-glucanase (GH16 family)
VEVRAKLPNGKHLWPAIWMLPTDDFYGVWAASGEIDIMEARGQKPTISSSTLHYGGTWPNNRNTGHEQDWATDLTNSFHVYGLEWSEDEMIFRMDDTVHFRIDLNRNWYGGAGANPYNANRQPWDWRFHLILNMAIGGGFFNGYPPLTPAEADLWSDPTLAIDWVHVYQDLSIPDPHGVVPAGSVNDTAAGTWNLVWSDEFDGNAIDGSKWVHEVDCNGGGNNEYQCYTSRSENSVVRDGKLIITAKHEHYTANGQTRDYTSARLRGLQAWKYGKVSASIKLPNGKHLWPAFWMLPQDNVYGQWAASGEIDIMEAKGERINSSSSALHFGGGWPNNRFVMHEQDWGKDLSTGFHEFSVEWNSEWMAFSVDNEEHFRVNLTRNWYGGVGPNPYKAEGQPWDQKFHLMINMAVAGGFFKGFPPLSFADADAWADPTYAIDWVRVYEWVPGN